MRLTWLLSLPTILSVTSALAIEKRDADFLSVRTKQHKDMSGKGGDSKGKYFHESVFHPHYDGRFADKQLGYRERRLALSNLIQTYLSTFSDIGVETWLMHGTLLGWWWNRKILPWDSDSDVQVSEASMHYLASYYNMSVFHYKTPRIPEGRDYMLEVNPHYVTRDQSDRLNVIDARWIDTTSGLFIDITTARYNYTHPAGAGMLSCKDGHEYRDSYIFPLRDTFFEGAPAKIPFAYKELLEAEYKEKALTLTDFEGHHFDELKLEWVPVPKKLEEKKQQEKKEQEDKKKAEEKKAADKKAEDKKAEEKKVADNKSAEKVVAPPAQNQQGQQKQAQQPQQDQPNNQQKQPTDQQKPPTQEVAKSDEKPQAPSGGKPQGESSSPPPIAKQGTQPLPTSKPETKKPSIQIHAEEKAKKAQEKMDKAREAGESRRKNSDEILLMKEMKEEANRGTIPEKEQAKLDKDRRKKLTEQTGMPFEVEKRPVESKPKSDAAPETEPVKADAKSLGDNASKKEKEDDDAQDKADIERLTQMKAEKIKAGEKANAEKKTSQEADKKKEQEEAEKKKSQKSEVRSTLVKRALRI